MKQKLKESERVSENIRMVDVSEKTVTFRRSLARGTLELSRDALNCLEMKTLPKGDAFKAGEIAGILAAKRTALAIPLCHPLALDSIQVWFDLDKEKSAVHSYCKVSAHSRTGVEMEALSGVTGALITIYDFIKQIDSHLTLTDIRLEFKEGGKTGTWKHRKSSSSPLSSDPQVKSYVSKEVSPGYLGKALVITVSDRCHQGLTEDQSGPLLSAGLHKMGFEVYNAVTVPDEIEKIMEQIRNAVDVAGLVVLTGGTGLSPRDVTPEAVAAVCPRLIPGIGEALRMNGSLSTPMSFLSRSLAGQIKQTLVIALPGSPNSIRDGLRIFDQILPHALHVMRKGNHA